MLWNITYLLSHHLFFFFLTHYLSLQIKNVNGQQLQQQQRIQLSDTSVDEWRGYFRKEHSLAKPYQGYYIMFIYHINVCFALLRKCSKDNTCSFFFSFSYTFYARKER